MLFVLFVQRHQEKYVFFYKNVPEKGSDPWLAYIFVNVWGKNSGFEHESTYKFVNRGTIGCFRTPKKPFFKAYVKM